MINKAAMQSSVTASGERSRTLAAAAVAIGLGLFLVWGVGLANSATVHDTAHDTRHAFSFPCH
jgi:cobalt transporter subunit CbtB